MSVVEQIAEKVATLPPAQQTDVLRYVEEVQRAIREEDLQIGEAGRRFMSDVLQPEDFSWLKSSQK